jgi:hypothetical protein
MAGPKCPTELQLKNQRELVREIGRGSTGEEARLLFTVDESLEYLETYLSNRKYYQKKQQIKKKVLMRLAHEQGWDKEIDDAVAMQHGNIATAETLDELEDTQS